jgi:hypothetical protein
MHKPLAGLSLLRPIHAALYLNMTLCGYFLDKKIIFKYVPCYKIKIGQNNTSFIQYMT